MPVLLDQCARLGRNQFLNHLLHVAAMQFVQLRCAEQREGVQAEGKKFIDIQIACLVFVVKTLVRFFVLLAIHDALLGQKLSPQIIAVAREQGVIKVKYGQTQGRVFPVPIYESCASYPKTGAEVGVGGISQSNV